MKQLLPLIIIFLFLASCGRSKNTTASTLEQYDLTQAVSGSLADVFSDVELTPLRYGGGDYPKMVDRLILTDNLIIVSDLHKLIHIFDIDGNYLSSSSERMGEGPEEFPFATGYSWNNYTNSLEILSPYRLSFYDENMNFKGSMRLPTYGGEDNNRTFFLNSITDVSDSICLVHASLADSPHIIYKFSLKNGEIEPAFDYSDEVVTGMNSQNQAFFPISDGSILYVPQALTYNVYSFSEKDLSISKIITLNTGKKQLTKKLLDKMNLNDNNIGDFLINCDYDKVLRILPTLDYVIAHVSKGPSMYTSYNIFISRNSKKITRVNMYENEKFNSPYFCNVSNDYAYAVLSKERILESPLVLLDKKSQADSLLYDVEDDTFVLLKYKFKENL